MKITKATDIKDDRATYLLYAAPGTGKTYTMNFLPGKTLYVAIDKTEAPLKGNKNIDIVEFDTHNAWTEWEKLLKWLSETDLSKYENIVLDNISELFRSMLGNMGRVGNNNRVPTMMNYQQIDFVIIDSVRYINSLNKRVVMLAWESSDDFYTEDGQKYNRAMPDVRDKILNNIMGLCQVVGRLSVNNKTGNRGFILSPNNTIFAKNQLDDRKACKQEDIFTVGNMAEKEASKDVPTS